MDTMVATFLAGTLAAVIHVLSGPDHLAAVAPFALRRKRAWLMGAKWGVGHTAGVAVIALVALMFREAIPVERISFLSERLVGVVLVAIGFLTLRSVFRKRFHVHAHEHDGQHHVHMHVHGKDGHGHPASHRHSHAPLWVGVLHGGAGSAHLLGVLPALALATRAESLAYLAGYGAGTLVAMIAFAAVLGEASKRAGTHSAGLYRAILTGAGTAALVVGAVWIIP